MDVFFGGVNGGEVPCVGGSSRQEGVGRRLSHSLSLSLCLCLCLSVGVVFWFFGFSSSSSVYGLGGLICSCFV